MTLKRIAIVGPESTGKSELAAALAGHYKTNWVEEYARTYLENLNRNYEYEDLLNIAKGQIELEDASSKNANGILFCDTNLVVVKIWSEFKFNKCDNWILKQIESRQYDFYLLTNIDLPWQPDPLREHPCKRKELFEIYKRTLTELQTPFKIVSGIGEERLRNAVDFIEENLS